MQTEFSDDYYAGVFRVKVPAKIVSEVVCCLYKY